MTTHPHAGSPVDDDAAASTEHEAASREAASRDTASRDAADIARDREGSSGGGPEGSPRDGRRPSGRQDRAPSERAGRGADAADTDGERLREDAQDLGRVHPGSMATITRDADTGAIRLLDDPHAPSLLEDLNFSLSASSVATLAAGVGLGILFFEFISNVVSRLQGLLIILVVSLFLSFAMEPAVQWLSRRGIRRGLGTSLVFVVSLALFAGFVAAMSTLVVGQISNLLESGPTILDDLAAQARRLPGGVGDRLAELLMDRGDQLPASTDIATTVGRGALGIGSTLVGGLAQVLTILLVTFYMVADGPRMRRTLSSRMPAPRQREFLETWELAIAKTGGYVYSRLLTAVVSSLFHITAFTIIGVPYPVALGVWVGIISSLIPVIGTYIAGALPILLALSVSPATAVGAAVAIVIYQQIENYLVGPRINASTMELHPAVAFLSVIAGAALMGAAGALLALPAAAIVTALARERGERHDVMAHGLVEDHDPNGGGPEPA